LASLAIFAITDDYLTSVPGKQGKDGHRQTFYMDA
jgi:hypothetical protein